MQSKKKTRANWRFSFPLIFSNRLTPDTSYPVCVARTPYLQGHVRSASHAIQEKNTSEPAILIPSHFLKPSHPGHLLPRARRQDSLSARSCTRCITCNPRKKHERTGDSHSLSFSQTVSPRTPPTPCASPGLPICKVTYAVHHMQSKKKTRANWRFSIPLIFSNRLTPDTSYPVRVARTPYLQGHVPSASHAIQEKNTSDPAILKPSHFLKPSHASEAVIASNAGGRSSLTAISLCHRLPRAPLQAWHGGPRWS